MGIFDLEFLIIFITLFLDLLDFNNIFLKMNANGQCLCGVASTFIKGKIVKSYVRKTLC